jgi:anti-sigma factor RsiW
MWKVNERACGRAARSLGEYLDGTLPLARRRAVEAHLHACAGCRRELEAMRRTLALLSGLPRRELSEDFDAALQARLEAIKGVGRRVSGVVSSDPTPDLRHPRHYLRAPWPSPLRRLAPAGALTAVTLGMVAWRLGAVVTPAHPAWQPPTAPAYVQALVEEHQRLRTTSDLNAIVVSHNLGSDSFAVGEDE